MIDWWGLFTNALWVLALAWLLAILSTRSYRRSGGFRRKADEPDYPISLALMCFCIGLGLTSERWWEQTLWILLALLSLVQPLVQAYHKRHKPEQPKA